jgi:hypothetical protein
VAQIETVERKNMSESNNGMQVSVSDGQVLVQMKQDDQKLGHLDFATREVINLPAPTPGYYIAIDENGVMHRCVADCLPDKKVVAALVGNWVADGFNVMRVGRKELMKHLRKLESSSKAASGSSDATPNSEESAVAGNVEDSAV